eukprot:TRINITY_DN1206_c0_g2_i1.p1 TRINITY_DN1206_c0_g2~~TRINITY_DN1206_c0_g2_i1.p1  ORF type:complete len:521 (+),score=196.16 TRINITY_DN1206_c0_g2_i1:58-1620(+)
MSAGLARSGVAFAAGFIAVACVLVAMQRDQEREGDLAQYRADFETRVALLKREVRELSHRVKKDREQLLPATPAPTAAPEPLVPATPKPAAAPALKPTSVPVETERMVTDKSTGEKRKLRKIVAPKQGGESGAKRSPPPPVQATNGTAAAATPKPPPPPQKPGKNSWTLQDAETMRPYDAARYPGKDEKWVARKVKAVAEAAKAQELAKAEERRLRERAEKPEFTPLGKVGAVLNAYGDPKFVEDAFEVIENLRKASSVVTHFTVWTNERNKMVAEQHAVYRAAPESISLRYYEALAMPPFLERCPGVFQQPPPVFGSKISAISKTWELDGYDTTMVVDGDVHFCTNIDHLFPTAAFNYDLGASAAPFARYGASKHDPHRNVTLVPADPARRDAFANLPERNVGFMILRTQKQNVQMLLQKWRDIYAAQTTNSDVCKFYDQDQAAFREALFILEPTQARVAQRLFPHDKVCRYGDQVDGCISKPGCVLRGCDVVHCKVAPWARHRTRGEMLAGGKGIPLP